mgnify:CR=1 FL=1
MKCETCGEEKTCKQDREVLPIRLIVGGENGRRWFATRNLPSPTAKPQEKPKATSNGHSDANHRARLDAAAAYDETGKPIQG